MKSVAAKRRQPSDHDRYNLAQSFLVYGFTNGDYAGYASPRRGFMYTHDDGEKLEPFKLLKWPDRYFGS
jgi:hypothetical protein